MRPAAALFAAALASAPASIVLGAADTACDKRAALVNERLTAVVADEDELKALRIAATLPQAAHGAVPGERASVLGIEDGVPTFDGARVSGATPDAWVKEIEGRSQTLRSAAPGKPPWLYVVLDCTTPVAPLLPLFAGLGANHELQFVVEATPNPLARHLPAQVPPGARRYREQRAGLDPGSPEQAKLFGREIRRPRTAARR